MSVTSILPALALLLSLLSVEFRSSISLRVLPSPAGKSWQSGHGCILGHECPAVPLGLPVHKPQCRATPSPTLPSPEALTYAHTIHQLFSVFVNESTFYELEQTMPPCGLTWLPFPGCEPPQHPSWGDSGGERSCWTLPLGHRYPPEGVSRRLSAEPRGQRARNSGC